MTFRTNDRDRKTRKARPRADVGEPVTPNREPRAKQKRFAIVPEDDFLRVSQCSQVHAAVPPLEKFEMRLQNRHLRWRQSKQSVEMHFEKPAEFAHAVFWARLK
jgi:hypothetical protein